MARRYQGLEKYRHYHIPAQVSAISHMYDKYPVTTKPTNKNLKDNKMPYRKRKYNKKRKRRGMVKRRIPRAIQPKTKLVRVKASQYATHTGTAGALVDMYVQGNSILDPFGADGAGQPLGFDQWKALYKSAFVIGSKVSLTFYNGATTSVIYGITPMGIDQGNISLGNYEYYKELPATKARMLSPDVDHGYLSSKVSTKRHLSVKNLTDDDTLKIDLTTPTEPSKIWYWHLWAQATDQATTTGYQEFVADVEYILLLVDPIIPSRSVA